MINEIIRQGISRKFKNKTLKCEIGEDIENIKILEIEHIYLYDIESGSDDILCMDLVFEYKGEMVSLGIEHMDITYSKKDFTLHLIDAIEYKIQFDM